MQTCIRFKHNINFKMKQLFLAISFALLLFGVNFENVLTSAPGKLKYFLSIACFIERVIFLHFGTKLGHYRMESPLQDGIFLQI